MTELKPCPFCGQPGARTTVDFVIGFPKDRQYTYKVGAKCEACHISVSFGSVVLSTKSPLKAEKMALTYWNTRTGEPKKMCANCKHCSEPGVRSDVVCFLKSESMEYHQVCEEWVGKNDMAR